MKHLKFSLFLLAVFLSAALPLTAGSEAIQIIPPDGMIQKAFVSGINVLACLKDELWIGTGFGIVKYGNDNWLHYYGNYYTYSDGKPVEHKGNSDFDDNVVNSILQHQDRLFFLTDYGLIEYLPEKFSFKSHTGAIKYSLYLNAGAILDEDTILLGTWGNGLSTYHMKSSTFSESSINISAEKTYITGIAGNSGSYWITTFNKGIFNDNKEDDRLYSYTIKNSKLESNRTKGVVKFDNCLFIMTVNGLLRLNPKDFIWDYFRKQNSPFKDDNMTCLANWQNKRLYIGTLQGLYAYNPAGYITNISDRNLDGAWISHLAAGEHDLWVSTKDGRLFRISH